MQRITIVSAVYLPEPVVSAQMTNDLAKHLVKLVQSVTVLCPQPSRSLNEDYIQNNKSNFMFETNEEGIKVVRLPSFTASASRLIPRLRESWSFGRHVCQYLATNGRLKPDVMYVNAWPLLAQALIMRYASRNKIPVVLQIMDIYPESLINKLPAIFRKCISVPLTMLDAWIAQIARTVVVISESMRRTYLESRGIPPNRVVTIPTWQDEGMYESSPARMDVCRRYGMPENLFTFLYLGNIGPVAGVGFLIQSFYEASIDSAQLLIVGEGSEKAACMKQAKKLNVANVHFITDPDAANVPILQSMAHVFMLPLKQGAGRSSIPSKLPAYMFSSKPVIATVDLDSDTAQVIRQAKCGWVGEPEDLSWLVDKMREVAGLPKSELERLGQLGKEYGLLHFSKSQGVKQLSEVIMESVSSHRCESL